jgi:hypothetical protein
MYTATADGYTLRGLSWGTTTEYAAGFFTLADPFFNVGDRVGVLSVGIPGGETVRSWENLTIVSEKAQWLGNELTIDYGWVADD